MFTGLIEEVGSVHAIKKSGQTMVISIQADKVLEHTKIGDSISVNGVCLTVTELAAQYFSADVMPETFRRTNLHLLSPGSPVNLERAMQANARFGGHIVQGHVDGCGVISDRREMENATVFTIRLDDPQLLRYMIDQGSITVDGISLTIVQVTDEHFTVSIIPHTLQHTALQEKKRGDVVNIECDVIGKYVEKMLRPHREKPGRLNEQFLRDHGFA